MTFPIEHFPPGCRACGLAVVSEVLRNSVEMGMAATTEMSA